MALDTEEQQQVEAVKKWFAENGFFMIAAIVIAACLLFGYQKWQRIHEHNMMQASEYYEQLLNNLSAKDYTSADKSAEALIKKYPRNTYAELAQLLLAKQAIQQGHYSEAQTKLTEVIRDGHAALKEIARLRLARLYIEIKAPQQALDILKQVDAKIYQPDIKAVEGDAYVALNHISQARASYQQALSGLPDEAILHNLVSMKLNSLPI